MSLENGLRTRLKADSAVSAITTNVEWDERPQASSYPAVVLETVIGNDTQHMKGFNTYSDTIVQFSCFATSKTAATNLRDAVKAAIVPEGEAGGSKFLRATDVIRRQRPTSTNTGMVHMEILEARIWHT